MGAGKDVLQCREVTENHIETQVTVGDAETGQGFLRSSEADHKKNTISKSEDTVGSSERAMSALRRRCIIPWDSVEDSPVGEIERSTQAKLSSDADLS